MTSVAAQSHSVKPSTQQSTQAARIQRGTGFDLSRRQSRIRRDNINERYAANANKYNETAIGHLIDTAIEKCSKKKTTKIASFASCSYAHGRTNDNVLESRYNQHLSKKAQKTPRSKPTQEYNALSDDFGPVLSSSTPLATPVVSWGAHLNHRPKAPLTQTKLESKDQSETKPSLVDSTENKVTKEAVVEAIQKDSETADSSDTNGPVQRISSNVAWGDLVDSDDDDEEDKSLTAGDSWADCV